MTRICLSAIVLSCTLIAQSVAAAGHTDNNNIVRMATGKHSFYEEDGTTLRGEEYFRMIVHPDMSRTMIITKNMFSDVRHHNIMMRVNEAFRPIEAFASYHYPDGFKGSIRVIVDGDVLRARSYSGVGITEDEVTVPPAVAVITHGEGLNSWNASVMDPADTHDGGPVELQRASYFISPTREGDGPVLGRFSDATLTRVGEETITTPAGTFETIHYSTGILDVWAMKGDRILVKQTYRNETYILTEYTVE